MTRSPLGVKMDITKLSTNDETFEIYAHGFPNYDGLRNTEKRAFLLPFVDMVRKFYEDPENLRQFEKWRAEKNKEIAL